MERTSTTRLGGNEEARSPLGATYSIDLPALAPASVSVAPMDLLGLIHRAATALAGAKTMAEAVGAMKLAQAAKELGKIIGAANEARADCLRLELLAQMQIAREYDLAKAGGQVAGHGRSAAESKVRDADLTLPTTEDLGLDKRRVAEWRKMADAGEQVVLAAISSALDEGREATAADVKRAVAGGPAFKYFCGIGNNEWYTPSGYIEAAREVMGGIDLDPASCARAQQTVNAALYFTENDCSLSKDWHGRVWMNPPYSLDLMYRFVDKLIEQYAAGNVSSAIVLTDNRTDTRWFHALGAACARICLTKGRIHFYSDGVSVGHPMNGSAFFYLGDAPAAFTGRFADFGMVVSEAAP